MSQPIKDLQHTTIFFLSLSASREEVIRRLSEFIHFSELPVTMDQIIPTLLPENETDLAGLSDGIIAQAAETAKNREMEGKWIITLQKPSFEPFLITSQSNAASGSSVASHLREIGRISSSANLRALACQAS